MNITSADPTAPPPHPPPQPSRSSFGCDRHPNEQFTGFCPSCLCERLTTLDPSPNTPSSSRRPSAAAAALKSIFSTNPRANNFPPPPPPPPPKPLKPASFLPELRRTKSFSASKNEALGQSLEPHRKSCDVRAKNTLCSLFSLDDESKNPANSIDKPTPASSSSHQIHHNSSSKPIASCVVNQPVLEEVENEEDFKDPPENLEDIIPPLDNDRDRDEIRPVENTHFENLRNAVELNANSSEIVEENAVNLNNLKPMKDHIDLVTQGQVKKHSGGGFWAAASVFSKKWHKWRRKQKIKKQSNGKSLSTLPVENPISRKHRETQSEIADYGFGRRSCDVDPRFSLDAPRISFDGPRYSFDEPRASWDGYLIGSRNFPRMAPMVSVLEDAPPSSLRADMQIPLEGPNFINKDEDVPGGSSQTRDYYLDSSSRRRKSLDRSNSIRKTAAAVVAEIDELKMASPHARVLRDDISETFELSSSGFKESTVEKKETKKGKKWGWRIWGFIHRRNHKDEDDEERYSKYSGSANGVERSLSHSWQELNGDSRGGFNRNVLRSNSSVSWRNANVVGGPFGNARRSNVEMYGNNGKRRSDFASDKNRNVRYSPSNLDNGLLRFYLTPTRSNHRRGGPGKIKPANSHRSALRLY